jgi:aspartate kinase
MFAALTAENINMKMITTADIKITVLLDRADGIRALRAVHQAFNLATPRLGAGLPPPPGTTFLPTPHRDLDALHQRLVAMEEILVSDVELMTDHGRVTIVGLPDQVGNCSRVFQAVADGGIVVDMIVQNMTAGTPELSFSVPLADLERSGKITREVTQSLDPRAEVATDAGIANLVVHGVGMRTHTGVARKIFGALAARKINISMINTSEVRFSVVVERARGEEALACLKEAFHLD